MYVCACGWVFGYGYYYDKLFPFFLGVHFQFLFLYMEPSKLLFVAAVFIIPLYSAMRMPRRRDAL